MEKPTGISVIADKQRRVEIYKAGEGLYQLQLYNSVPEAIKDIEEDRKHIMDIKGGYRRTILNISEQTMEAIVEAYITVKHLKG